MISVISIGICDYLNEDYSRISCAKEDAVKVYTVLKHALGDKFSDFSSICLVNIKLNHLLAFLESAFSCLGKDDIVVLYFSCHARLFQNDKLYLALADSSTSRNSCLPIDRLFELLSEQKTHFLVIMDCCHSEAGLSLANKQSIECDTNISVIASAKYFAQAHYSELGSIFTNNFCSTVQNIIANGSPLTVNTIATDMIKSGYECYVNIAQGNIDCLLDNANASFVFTQYAKLPNIFLERLKTNAPTRAMLWYSLADMPPSISIDTFKLFIKNSDCICEAHWLVRRAIGNLLCTSSIPKEQLVDIVVSLLSSKNWMLQTIGVMGAKHIINQDIARLISNIVNASDSNMSLVWLADLYLSDSCYSNITDVMNSSLSKSVWGLISIYDRYSSKYGHDVFLDIISQSIKDARLVAGLHQELNYRGIINDNSLLPENHCVNQLIKDIYAHNPRGRTLDINKKWLLSILFGNWRGQIVLDLRSYMNNTAHNIILNDLQTVQHIPNPARRASLFVYMHGEHEIFDKYKEALDWGFSDPHPWVRRAAFLAFKDYPEQAARCFSDTFDRNSVIGVFDFIISAAPYLDPEFVLNYCHKYSLTSCEYASLQYAINFEKLV